MQIVVRVMKYRGKNRRPPQYFFVKAKGRRYSMMTGVANCELEGATKKKKRHPRSDIKQNEKKGAKVRFELPNMLLSDS